MKIRSIRPADLDSLATMVVEFEKHLAAMDGKRIRLSQATVRRDLVRRGFGPRAFFRGLIAGEGRECCGYLLYHFAYDATARRGALEVSDLYVRKAWRRKAVGKALMQRARDIALKRGCSRMRWMVWNRNPPAMAFYLGLGATTVDDEILMDWKIAP
ncbi:MAG: N-acetyltransferase family protein [Nitrospira sp.]